MVSTSHGRVPPVATGGVESIVATLIDGLSVCRVTGTLFAANTSLGGYRHPWEVRSPFDSPPPPSSASPQELVHHQFVVEEINGDGGFHVAHAHTPGFLVVARELEIPVVYTQHRPLEVELDRISVVGEYLGRSAPITAYETAPGVFYVAISRRQQELYGLPPQGMIINHGLHPEHYRLATPRPDSVAFLGRLARAKGPHTAIDIARSAGLRIRIGGPPFEISSDPDFSERELSPRMGQPHVEYLGDLPHGPKADLLSQARALLMPVTWEEPFGLVVIEAALSGCPVVAFPRGSMKEVIDEGITGFIARDENHMVELLKGPAHPDHFDRRRCRQHAVERFSSARMAADYLRVYRGLHRLSEVDPEIAARA